MSAQYSRRRFLAQSAHTTAAAALAVQSQTAARAANGSEKVKIGQIGVGHSHAEGKMRVYRNSPEFDVVGIVEPDDSLRRKAQSMPTYRDLPWMTQEQLLNQPGLQAVAVETSVSDLLAAAEAAVDAGMHIHLDKPAGTSLPRFESILHTADSMRRTVQMGYMYRYNPGVLLLKDLLQKGWLGEIFEVHTVMSKDVGDSKRQKWANFSGGTMFELGCHLVDLVVGLLGRPEKVTAFNQHAGANDDTLKDNMLAVMTYPRAIASVKSSALEIEGFDRRHLTVCGTEGTLHIQPLDDPKVRLALSEPRGEYQTEYQDVAVGSYERYVADAKDFAKIIRGEKSADYDSAHDLTVQQVLLQACEMPTS